MKITYIFAISNSMFNSCQQVIVEETSRERAVQKAKGMVFPETVIQNMSIEEIHDMFYDSQYVFESTIMIEGTNYKSKYLKK